MHTPASARTQLGSPSSDETWKKFANSIADAAARHKIDAIVLSDYFTLEGYSQLEERGIYSPGSQVWKSGRGNTPLLVIPGVELRLSQITIKENPVNLHVIFDPKRLDAERLTRDFLGRLALDPDHGQQKLHASREHLLALGKSQKTGVAPDLNERLILLPPDEQQSFWEAAMDVAAVGIRPLLDLLKELDNSVDGGRSHLVAIANSGHGGLHELPWEGHLAAIRHSLMASADLLFTSNDKDRAFLLGKDPDTPEEEFLQRFGRLKASVWGSDAKEADRLLHPSNGKTNRYTWVKADLSFEGLKQLLYEPADRVAVQESAPHPKPWNSYIDAVRFIDDAKQGFAVEDWIPLSESLTALIGGKSSGKSLLLHLIAKTIDAPQVRERVGSGPPPYDGIEQDIGFEVRWKNGDIQTLNGAGLTPSRITYLPQSYINKLAEPESQEQLAEVILRLLKEDVAFGDAERQLRRDVETARGQVGAQLQKLFELKRQVSESNDRISTTGNEQAILAEIARLETELADIRKTAGLTAEEQPQFDALIVKQANRQRQSQSRAIARERVLDTKRELERIYLRVSEDLLSIGLTSITSEVVNDPSSGGEIVLVLRNELADAFNRASTSLQEQEIALAKEITEDAQHLEALAAEIEPFNARLTSRERADAAAEALERQKILLGSIREEQDRRDRLKGRLTEAIDRLLSSYRQIHDTYSVFQKEHLAGGEKQIAPDVLLEAGISFDAAGFWTAFQEGLDGRQRLTDITGLINDGTDYKYVSLDSHVANVRKLLSDLVGPDADRSLRIRRAFTPDVVAAALTRDHFVLSLTLTHDGDSLQRMSPGKRGMVLLRLLLEMSDATHPILIDQPEDNLDNRTVFKQLRHAIRERKKHRQILLATHNANLVVSTDAECVVVANQYGLGDRVPEIGRFEYRGGSLEHSVKPSDGPSVLKRQGTREHVCEILEGGEQAFKDRQEKYEFAPR